MKFKKDDVIKKLWQKGLIEYKLDKMQTEMVEKFIKSNKKIQVWLQSRRIGKSYTLVVLAIKYCLGKPNTIVKFCAPTRLMVETIINPLLNEICQDCPENLLPTYDSKTYTYKFYNGSIIQLAGTDMGNADRLRGGSAHLCIVDEAGMCSDLSYVVKSVLIPTTLTTKGKIILSTTPPKQLNHDVFQFIEEAEADNALTIRTIYDNPRITQSDVDDIIKACGGKESEFFKREFLCISIKDSSSSVIPEFNAELKSKIIKPSWEIPEYFDYYTAIDLGFKDLTAGVFAIYDYLNDKIVVIDELCLSYKDVDLSLPKLSKIILEKEKKISSLSPYTLDKPPYKRVCDAQPVVLQEFTLNGVYFNNLVKRDKAESLNQLRHLLREEKIIILNNCKNLIRHLDNVKWQNNSNKVTFARSPEDGHYDLVDAILYLIKSIDFNKNPYPYGYTFKNKRVAYNNFNNKNEDILKILFNLKK